MRRDRGEYVCEEIESGESGNLLIAVRGIYFNKITFKGEMS